MAMTLHMYARDGEIGSARVDGGRIMPGGSDIVTRAIETSVRRKGWTAEAAVQALDGQWNGYWCYSVSDVNPYDLAR